MADVMADGIPVTGATEKALPLSENVSPPTENFSLPPANVTSPPTNVGSPAENDSSLSENVSPPNGNVNAPPENISHLAKNVSPPIKNSPPTGYKSLSNDRSDDFEVNSKLDGSQTDSQATGEELSRADESSTFNIHPDSMRLSNQKDGNVVESQRDFQAAVSHPTEDESIPKFSNSPTSNASKKVRSDNLISRSVMNSARHLNSRFMDGSLPSYALPTVAFQIRISLTTDKVLQDDIPTCHRYKSPSPLCHRHKRRRSHSLDNGLELENGPKNDRCYSAQPWKANRVRPKGSTPLHGFPAKFSRDAESRPSSAATDPSARGSNVKSLFTKEKTTSDSNSSQVLRKNLASAKPSQFSPSITEPGATPHVKNTVEKTSERPKSVTGKESCMSDDVSLKSKKPAWKQTTKASPDKELSSPRESGLKLKMMEKVVPPVGSSASSRDDKERGKDVLSISREPTSKPTPETATSPTKAIHDRAPVRVPKPAEDKNLSVGKEHGLKPPPDKAMAKVPSMKTKQLVPAKTSSSETAASSRDLSPTKTLRTKSSPSPKDVLVPIETRQDLSTSGKVSLKPQETKPGQNKAGSNKKEPKKAPTPSREERSVGNVSVNNEVKSTADEGESCQQSQTIKSSANGKEKTMEGATEKTSATTESPAGPQKEKESSMDEYRAKLAEKRKEAREKAEHEAEEERLRQEQERLAEEERKRLEEEEERRRDEEEMRLAEELRRLEEERYRRSVEEADQRRKEEAERIEAEAKAKAEQEAMAKLEAERLEKLRLEKKKREEEEKLERKKRLEKIMQRVKTDETTTKVETKNGSEHPAVDGTLNQLAERSSLESSTQHGTVSQVSQADDCLPHFRSPLLQQLLTGRAKPQAVVVGNFLDNNKRSANVEAPEMMSCLYEEPKTAEEPSRIVLSQEMAS